MAIIFLTTTGAGTWTVPSDWNNNLPNKFEVIAGGAGGDVLGGAAGGGAYSSISNITLTPGTVLHISIAAGVAASTNGNDTWLRIDAGTTAPTTTAQGVLAKGGLTGSTTTGGAGGAAGSGVGTVTFSGGAGGSLANSASGGGGGAAGLNGNGGAGAAGLITSGGPGGQGDNGQGGAPGAGVLTGTAQAGGPGSEYTLLGNAGGPAGSGGGGGGSTTGTAGAGGNYGGGGGAATTGGTSGAGAQGIIVITYQPWSSAALIDLSQLRKRTTYRNTNVDVMGVLPPSSISSTIASAVGEGTTILSRLVYDPTAQAVGIPKGEFLPNLVSEWLNSDQPRKSAPIRALNADVLEQFTPKAATPILNALNDLSQLGKRPPIRITNVEVLGQVPTSNITAPPVVLNDLSQIKRLAAIKPLQPDVLVQLQATPTISSTIASSVGEGVTILSRLVYDPTAQPVGKPIIVAQPTTVVLDQTNVVRRAQLVRSQLPTSFVFAIPNPTFGFDVSDEGFRRLRKRIADDQSLAQIPPAIAAAPPVVLSDLTQLRKYQRIRDNNIDVLGQVPSSVASITSTIACVIGEGVTILSRLVYDPTAQAVGIPKAIVTPPFLVNDLSFPQLTKSRRVTSFLDSFAAPLGVAPGEFLVSFVSSWINSDLAKTRHQFIVDPAAAGPIFIAPAVTPIIPLLLDSSILPLTHSRRNVAFLDSFAAPIGVAPSQFLVNYVSQWLNSDLAKTRHAFIVDLTPVGPLFTPVTFPLRTPPDDLSVLTLNRSRRFTAFLDAFSAPLGTAPGQFLPNFVSEWLNSDQLRTKHPFLTDVTGFLWTPQIIIPFSALIYDPRFITAPNACLPSNNGAARVFVTTPKVTGMPYGNDLSVIDPTVEKVTVTFNFAPWLAPGVTVTSVISITAQVSTFSLIQDLNPSGIIVGSSQIEASPTTGAANTAVLQQFGSCQSDVIYLLECLVATSDNQLLQLATHLPCAALN